MKTSQVAIVIPSLLGGGAERVAVDLANHWSRQARQVTLITLDRGDQTHYPLSPEVCRIGLDLMRPSRSWWGALRNNFARIARLRAALRRSGASTAVSFLDTTNVTTLLACPAGLRTIVCERTDPRHHQLNRVWKWLRRWTYGGASAIVVQTESVRQWAESFRWNRPLIVIPNAAPAWCSSAMVSCTEPVSPGSLESGPDASRRPLTIVGLGRLSDYKGFHYLIEAFAELAPRFPQWHVRIYGEGPERARLEQQIEQHGLRERVHLPGWIEDVPGALSAADIFVMTSRYEGFPNALLEAMAAGLACISFDCDSGPREIIRQGKDGCLVPRDDVPGLTAALAALMSDAAQRQTIGIAAREVSSRFSMDDVFRRWDALLDESAG